MKHRSTYWSNTKFANWLRGETKPRALTLEGWDDWEEATKQKQPFRYWLAETALDKIQDIVCYPSDKYKDVIYYIENRFISRANSLTAHPKHIKPGEWSDLSNRILYCLFDELVDFVEIEKASRHIYSASEEIKYKRSSKWYEKWRCKEAGIDYLRWEMSLVKDDSWGLTEDDAEYGQLTSQAISAKWVYDAYMWWTEVRENRPDVYEATGWTAYCDSHPRMFSRREDSEEEQAVRRSMLDEITRLEKEYEDDDNKWLHELIDHRLYLWT